MEILNLRTIGYQFASAMQSERNLASQVKALYPNFGETIPDNARAELYEGFTLRFAENNPNVEKTYVLDVTDGRKWYRPVAEGEKLAKDANKIHLSVGFVMAESSQKFSSLKDTNPPLYELAKPVREAVIKYNSNTIKALQRKVRELDNEGKTRTRSATKSFAEVVTDTMLDFKKKCKAAQARGDETANDKLLGEATVAFMTIWNHKR